MDELERWEWNRPWARSGPSAVSEALREFAAYLESDGARGRVLGGPMGLRGADLSGMPLDYLYLSGSDLTGAQLAAADLYKTELEHAILDGANLAGAWMRRTQMGWCEARGAVFAGSNMLRARLWKSNLTGADFRGAWTPGTSLSGSDLRGADFRGTRFSSSGEDSPMQWTSLNEARMAGCSVAWATGHVVGPVDVGADEPRMIEGEELAAWFAGRGAPDVRVERR